MKRLLTITLSLVFVVPAVVSEVDDPAGAENCVLSPLTIAFDALGVELEARRARAVCRDRAMQPVRRGNRLYCERPPAPTCASALEVANWVPNQGWVCTPRATPTTGAIQSGMSGGEGMGDHDGPVFNCWIFPESCW